MMRALRKLELTLAILKPDVVAQPHILKEIRSVILQQEFLFVRSKKLILSPTRAKEFYKEHDGKFFLNRLVSFMSSGPIWTHILARENAIPEWRRIMGPTKVLKTIHEAPETIRGRFGLTDTRNCTHGSDSTETAAREIKFFFPEFSIGKWHDTEETHFFSRQVSLDEDLCQHVSLQDVSDAIS
ncbi:nucleoside diphosphate kinase 6-like isoform X2 [Haliotis rubra]|uniref:nucleoside diphosphate kinase 6-like isoform X1 n=1 Tax=Haliotis rubra TaxID=36100 RepID=UPI001EE5513C|nr:nucleoside diphosphate kinase 6-like isoform X1 [Haliotis rubra]XP_046576017.1 nucleoside diphosphate kinase 6-like isoform X2 [Haliotis rubra]